MCCPPPEQWGRDLQQSDAGGQEGLQDGRGPRGRRRRTLRPPVRQSGGDAPVEPEHTANQSEGRSFQQFTRGCREQLHIKKKVILLYKYLRSPALENTHLLSEDFIV